MERPWKETELINKEKSAQNLRDNKLKANEGQEWGRATLIKNFSEIVEL